MISIEVYEKLDIKEEQDERELISFDDGSNKWKFVPKCISFEKGSTKCGEVMVACEGTFTFVCSLCLQTFGELLSFGSHIRDKHMQFEFATATIKHEKELDPLRTSVEAAKLIPSEGTNIASSGQHIDKISRAIVNKDGRNQYVELLDSSTEMSSSDEYEPANEKVDKSKVVSILEESFCIFCGRKYKLRWRLQLHIEKMHKNEFESKIVERDTGKEEDKNSALSTFTCKYCDKKFDDASAFKTHVATHIGPRKFVCPYCPKTFPRLKLRDSHVNTHTGEKPHKCTHCSKSFADVRNLETHIRSHLKIFKYSCKYCGRRFIQCGEKNVHERTHTGEKPYQCEECGKRFISHSLLTEHSRRHKNIKNYKCEICDKAFCTFDNLKNHMRTHTGERPFHCKICDQEFSRRGALWAHEKLHSNEKKYVCDTCGKAFAQYAAMYSHRKSHGQIPR